MNPTDNYTAVSLFTIPPDEPLPFSVSVYYRGHFVLYRKSGQAFDVGKYNRFIYKRISKLYISDADLDSYKEFVRQRQAIEEQKFNDPKLSVEQKVTNKTIRSLDLTTRELFAGSDEDMGANVAKVVGVAKDTVQRICERPYLRIFDSIPSSSSVISHSMRVSLMATFLGYQLGFVNPLALENLAAAGMLHDIGKTRLAMPDEIEMTEEQEKEIELNHSTLSVEELKKFPLVPEEVVHIITEHHERRDGTGFPNKMRGRQMHGLTKVFVIANTFDNLVTQFPGEREAKCRLAAEKMEQEMRAWFEPMLLPKALKLLVAPG
ncbi:MAG: HD domain-containing protein [Deltaproteobacteria bacterium]|nr:HD domain-containing protein [Deltaproteobacteria bacterium]